MKLNFRKSLLAGTAMVAVGAFAVSDAQAQTATLTGNTEWASGAAGAVDGDGTTASAGHDAVMTTHSLTFTNDATNNDGSADANTFAAGDVTSTTGNLIIEDDGANNLAVTIGSYTASGTGDFSVSGKDANTANIAASVTGALSTGGALNVIQTETSSADTMALTVGGALTVTGTTAVTAGAFAGATSTLNADGNTDFTGAVTATGGAGAGANAVVTLSGATNTFTGGLNLVTAAKSILTIDGTVAQTVTGVISGAGDINVTNTHASGVTFAGDSTNTGTITMNVAATDQAVTFNGDVASDISLGDDTDTDTKTATFNGTTQTISGAISGGGAADTVALVFTGGDTVTLSGATTSNIDTVAVTGNTTLDSDAAITATTITVASGSTLDQGAGAIGGAIANAGTIHQTGTGAVNGAITGAGTLNIDGTATYTGAITQSAATIATTKTLTTVGAYTVGTTTLEEATSGITFTTGNDATTNIVATAVDKGVVTFTDVAATSAFTGNIGTATSKINDFVITDGANAAVVTLSGNLYANDIDLGQADSLRFVGTGTNYVTGTVDAANDTGAGLVIGDGTNAKTVTFEGIVGGSGNIDSLTINDLAKTVFRDDATFDGAFSADQATIEGAAGKTVTVATLTDADVVTYNVNVDKVGGGAQTHSKYAATGDAFDLSNDTVHFQVEASAAPLTVGASVLDNVFAGNAGATIAGATVTDNSYMYGFALVADTNNVDATVTLENSVNSLSTQVTNKNAGNMLMTTLAASTNTQINQIQSNVAAAGTAAAVNEVLEAAASAVDGGAVVASMGISNQSASIANTRMAALRSGNTVATGMSAGNAASGAQYWGQAFGVTADQDDRDGVNGYDANTYGIAVGMETEALSDNMAVGVALTYASTDVDSENATTTNTEVDSIQLTVYGDYDLDDRTYVSGQLGYSFNDNDTTRHNVGGTTGLTAKGNYDSNQISVRAEGGRSYAMEGNLTLTPSVNVAYMHYDADTYTETGAGGANLLVDADALNTFEVGVDVEAAWNLEQADGSVMKPAVRLGVRHDLIGDEFEANNTFTGGGTAFKTEGFDPAQTTFNGGVGVTYFSTNNWDLTANYDVEYKSDYVSHAGLLKAAYNF